MLNAVDPAIGKEHLLSRVRLAISSTLRGGLGAVAMAAALAFSSGCDTKSLFDPSELAGRNYQSDKKVLPVQILDSIDPTIEETNVEFLGAADPTADDANLVVEDYRLGAN